MIAIKVALVLKLEIYVANSQIVNEYALKPYNSDESVGFLALDKGFKHTMFVCLHRNILSTKGVDFLAQLSLAYDDNLLKIIINILGQSVSELFITDK